MTNISKRNRARMGTAMAALALGLVSITVAAAPASAQSMAARPSETLNLSQGKNPVADVAQLLPHIAQGALQPAILRRRAFGRSFDLSTP